MTWKKMLRWRGSASWTCQLPSATRTPTRSTCGTRTTSSSPWRPRMTARWPALWWPSSRTYLHFYPTPSTAHPTIVQSPRRVTRDGRRDEGRSSHVLHLYCRPPVSSLVELLMLLVSPRIHLSPTYCLKVSDWDERLLGEQNSQCHTQHRMTCSHDKPFSTFTWKDTRANLDEWINICWSDRSLYSTWILPGSEPRRSPECLVGEPWMELVPFPSGFVPSQHNDYFPSPASCPDLLQSLQAITFFLNVENFRYSWIIKSLWPKSTQNLSNS